MKYSHVALLLALVLVGRTADAWVLNSQLLMPYEKIVIAPLSSAENSQQTKASQLPSFWLADDVISADGPNARAEEKLGSDQRLAALFHRGISLLKNTSRKTIAYVSLRWQQAVEYCRDHNPKVEVEKIGVDMRATLDDLVEKIRLRYVAKNQNRVDDGVRSLASVKGDSPILSDTKIGTVPDIIERLCAGYWPNHGNIKPWYCECEYDLPFLNWTDEGSPLVPSMTTGLVSWAKKLVEDWGAAFRNTSHRFAQLNWTNLLKDHVVEQAAGISMPATR